MRVAYNRRSAGRGGMRRGGGSAPDSASHILTEASDRLTTESGDHLITE